MTIYWTCEPLGVTGTDMIAICPDVIINAPIGISIVVLAAVGVSIIVFSVRTGPCGVSVNKLYLFIGFVIVAAAILCKWWFV